jgi:hypothetical protein
MNSGRPHARMVFTRKSIPKQATVTGAATAAATTTATTIVVAGASASSSSSTATAKKQRTSSPTVVATPGKTYDPRALSQATADHTRFIASGGKKDLVKNYHNQLRSPIVNNEFSGRVAPSPLHVTLGLTQRCFELYQNAARELDRPIIERRTRGLNAALDTLFDEERAVVLQLRSDRHACDAIKEQKDMVRFQSDGIPSLKKWADKETKELNVQYKDAIAAVKNGEAKAKRVAEQIAQSEGPFCRSIDTCMFEPLCSGVAVDI